MSVAPQKLPQDPQNLQISVDSEVVIQKLMSQIGYLNVQLAILQTRNEDLEAKLKETGGDN